MIENKNNIALDMLYLVTSALHNRSPHLNKVSDMDLDKLYHMSKFHSMTAIVCMALELSGIFDSDAIAPSHIKKWRDEKDKAVRKTILFDVERQQITDFMEKQGIWYMPLKGVIIKDLYPKIGMRQMSDNDILFDKSYRKELRIYMVSNGYKWDREDHEINDVYKKPPVFNFEMHWELFKPLAFETFYEYYKDVKDRLIKVEGKSYGYHFSDEDYYIYLIAHTHKHYNLSGVGLRSLMDCYVYNSKKGDSLDYEYIDNELKKLNIHDFEKQLKTISEKVFADPDRIYEMSLTQQEQQLLGYFTNSGAYGTMKNIVDKNLKTISTEKIDVTGKIKLKYYIKRVFPNMEWFKLYAPYCYQHKWTIPFYCVFRFFRGIFFKRIEIKNEIDLVKKAGQEHTLK